ILSAACTATGGAANCNIEVVTATDGRRKVLARGGQSPRALLSSSRNGHLLWINGSPLFAIPFDPVSLETSGTAVPVLSDVGYHPGTGAGHFEVSRTGTLVYRRSRADAGVRTTMQWVDATGKKEPLRSTPGAYVNARISPDGKRIVVVIREGGNQDLWVYEPQRDGITRLTFGGLNGSPVWSPDGQYVVYLSLAQGMFQARADGGSPPQALIANPAQPWSFT